MRAQIPWPPPAQPGAWHSAGPFILMFVYLEREKERESMSRGGTERGETESQAGSTQSVKSQMWGSIWWTVRSWPEPKSRDGCLTDRATQAPPPRPPLRFLINIWMNEWMNECLLTGCIILWIYVHFFCLNTDSLFMFVMFIGIFCIKYVLFSYRSGIKVKMGIGIVLLVGRLVFLVI